MNLSASASVAVTPLERRFPVCGESTLVRPPNDSETPFTPSICARAASASASVNTG
jgi:hypothetical protein